MSTRKFGVTMALLLAGTAWGCGDGDEPSNTNNNQNEGTHCGDGVPEGVEECDEGPSNSDTVVDACRTDCLLAHCGDGVADTGEACDDGPLNADQPNACRPGCVAPTCGDGIRDHALGEECDDGNDVGDDGCSANCLRERCGNGATEPGEECDDGNNLGGDGCSADCASTEICGNAIVDVATGETCDEGATNGVSPTLCRQDCTITVCGDGYLGGIEQCDASALGGADCVSFGFTDGTLGCSVNCTHDTTRCFVCGDGLCDVEAGEQLTSCPADCGVLRVDAGQAHTCAVMTDGTARCWGLGYLGQLGTGDYSSSAVPVPVVGLADTLEIDAGLDTRTCARAATGQVSCWGSQDPLPLPISGLSTAMAVSVGAGHRCALESNGSAWCWGNNNYGQLGTGSPFNATLPEPVSGGLTFARLSAGGAYTCGVTTAALAFCWGSNPVGQLGDGTTLDRTTPTPVAGIGAVDRVSVGAGNHTCALLPDATIRCWGAGGIGQLGNGAYAGSMTPVTVSGVGAATEVTLGLEHSCALLSNGEVWCWGANDYGQLGDGTTTPRATAAPVTGVTTAVTLTAGTYYTCVTLGDGSARCWGRNDYGQLGTGTHTDSALAMEPVGL